MIRQLFQTTVCVLTLIAAAPLVRADVKVPTTADEHFALAKQYQTQAAAHRKEAQDHREMAEAYKKTVANSHSEKSGQKDPWVVKMTKHCEAIAKTADELATEDEKAADYHTFRGKEMQGK